MVTANCKNLAVLEIAKQNDCQTSLMQPNVDSQTNVTILDDQRMKKGYKESHLPPLQEDCSQCSADI